MKKETVTIDGGALSAALSFVTPIARASCGNASLTISDGNVRVVAVAPPDMFAEADIDASTGFSVEFSADTKRLIGIARPGEKLQLTKRQDTK